MFILWFMQQMVKFRVYLRLHLEMRFMQPPPNCIMASLFSPHKKKTNGQMAEVGAPRTAAQILIHYGCSRQGGNKSTSVSTRNMSS